MLLTIICVLLIVDLLVFTMWDRYIFSLVILVAAAVGLWYLVPEVSAVITLENWRDIATYGLAYLAIGMGVAVAKWLLHVFKVGRFLTKCKESFVYTGEHIYRNTAFFRHVKDQNWGRVYKNDEFTKPGIARNMFSRDEQISEDKLLDVLTPKVADYATRITFWVFQWPFVVLGLLFEDILFRFGEWVGDFINAVFGRFTKYIVSNSIKGF